jgi:glycosyltransferase involved in cell wall biosynthesis
VGSPVAEWLLGRPQRLILVYHNVTPARFFDRLSPALARQMALGRVQLVALRPRAELALADSPYNERELREAGYAETGVLPIVLDAGQYALPSNEELMARYREAGPVLLFVGRLVPNKKQEDLIRLLYCYRRIEPQAQLLLVGAPWLATYERALREYARALGLADAVTVLGRVSQQDLVTCYRLAAAYVSMSEHEGFGKPLIESMYLELPVLAYAAGAVPDTLGGAGILFRHKHYEALAEMLDIMRTDDNLRRRIIARQWARVEAFSESSVRAKWAAFLSQVGLERG